MKNEMEQLIDRMINGGILFEEALQEFEKQFILKILGRHNNNLSKASLALGIHRNTLSKRVEQYQNGMAPEDMVRAYDTLELADIHAVIAYFLRHSDEVCAYLRRRDEEVQTLRTKIEAERPRVGLSSLYRKIEELEIEL